MAELIIGTGGLGINTPLGGIQGVQEMMKQKIGVMEIVLHHQFIVSGVKQQG